MRRLALACLVFATIIAASALTRAAEVLRLEFENAANLAEDTSGNAVPGSILQTDTNFFGTIAQSTNARPGSAGSGSLNLDAFSSSEGFYLDYADVDFPDFGPSDSWTVTLWVNPNTDQITDGQGFRGIVSGLSEGSNAALDWQIDNGATVEGGAGDGTTTLANFDGPVDFPLADTDLIAGQWQEIAVTYHAAPRNVLVFIDGALTAASSAPGGLAMDRFLVGVNRGEVRVYDGLIDDLVITDTPVVIDSGGVARAPGDLDFDGDVDLDDYTDLRTGLGTDVSALSALDAYQDGDVNFDGVIDINDFIDFKAIFESISGPGSLEAALSAPEPSAAVLLMVASLFGVRGRRRETAPLCTSPPVNRGRVPMRLPKTRTITAAAVLLAAAAGANAQALVFDFGNGDIDAVTGVAANFVVPDASPLGTLSNTQGGVELSITGITTNAPGTYDSNTQGFGIVSTGETGGGSVQRRIATAEDGETVQFSFDTDVTLSTLRVGALQSADEGFMLSFVSGDDPFAGGSFSYTTVDDGVTEAPDFDIPLGDIALTAGTVLEFSTLNEGGGGILWNDLRVLAGEPVTPLTLQVRSDGELRLLGGNPGGLNPASFIEIDSIQITSEDALLDGGSLNAGGYTGLAGDASFPAGDGSGNGWEPGLSNSPTFISENFLLGSSQIPNDAEISLGSAFVPGGEQDITFLYRQVGQSITTVGLVEYVDVDPPTIPGDFDGDGDVDVDDFGVFVNSFQLSPQGGPPFADGDFDEDGDVDVDDFGVFVNSFQMFPPPAVAVPEPAATVLVVTATIAAALRRR